MPEPVSPPQPNRVGAPPGREAVPEPDGPRIRLTPSALEAVRELLQAEGLEEEGGLRLMARFGAGCGTPLRFGLELDREPLPGELVLRGADVWIFVSNRDAWSLDGLEVDWVDSPGLGEGFAFRHPRGRGGRRC